jgi:hypothetical protein
VLTLLEFALYTERLGLVGNNYDAHNSFGRVNNIAAYYLTTKVSLALLRYKIRDSVKDCGCESLPALPVQPWQQMVFQNISSEVLGL